MMNDTYQFEGRGSHMMAPGIICLIESAAGHVLAISEMYFGTEFLVCYCRRVQIDKWGAHCQDGFRRRSDPGLTRAWAEKDKADLEIFRRCRIQVIAEEEWMTRFENRKMGPDLM